MPVEARAETLVPAVQRVAIAAADGAIIREAIAQQAEWDDPDDPNDKGQKKARQVVGYRRMDPLLTLHARGGDVTKDHLRAAHRFRDDYEYGHGARPPHQSTGPADDNRPGVQEMQFRHMDDYRAAMRALGIGLSGIVVMVVLEGRSPTSVAEEKGVSAVKTMGYLIAALDRLQEHYEGATPSKKGVDTKRQ